jgi:hypothetical protein
MSSPCIGPVLPGNGGLHIFHRLSCNDLKSEVTLILTKEVGNLVERIIDV